MLMYAINLDKEHSTFVRLYVKGAKIKVEILEIIEIGISEVLCIVIVYFGLSRCNLLRKLLDLRR